MNHPEQQGQLRMDVIQTGHAWVSLDIVTGLFMIL